MELTNEQKMAIAMRILGIVERLVFTSSKPESTQIIVAPQMADIDEQTEGILNDMIARELTIAEEKPQNG